MKRSFKLLTLLCTLSVSPSVAHAKDDGHDKDRATIKVDYATGNKAQQDKDIDAAVSFLTDDYTVISAAGKTICHSKDEQRTIFQRMFPIADKITSLTTIDTFVFTKEGVTVTNTNNFTFTLTRNGITHTLGDKSTCQDEWVKSGDIWLEKHSITTVGRHFVDGKPVK